MNKRKISLLVLIISLFSAFFSYSLVFAWNTGEVLFKLSDYLILDSLTLNKNKIAIYSKEDFSGAVVSWNCWIDWKLYQSDTNLYIFNVFSLAESCDKSIVTVKFTKGDSTISTALSVIDSLDLYEKFLDDSDTVLKTKFDSYEKNIEKYSIFNTYNENLWIEYFQYLKWHRKIDEYIHIRDFISDIIEKRTEKYIIPVPWITLTENPSKLPNSWRPYRNSYTDWIHHGFDFDTFYGDEVESLDYWVVIRVVDNFTDENFEKIKYWDYLTDLEKAENLDVLRWNQIWIKTMKWDVVFYSHLSEIYDNVEVGTILYKWEPVWKVWKSWVPGTYTDYHLHMPVQVNPHTSKNYTFSDYIMWDWYFKWKSTQYVVENQANIFETNEEK